MHQALAIPEIVDHIAHHLDRPKWLATAARVNQLWFDICVRRLWRGARHEGIESLRPVYGSCVGDRTWVTPNIGFFYCISHFYDEIDACDEAQATRFRRYTDEISVFTIRSGHPRYGSASLDKLDVKLLENEGLWSTASYSTMILDDEDTSDELNMPARTLRNLLKPTVKVLHLGQASITRELLEIIMVSTRGSSCA